MSHLKGKNVVITGGSNGIGEATAIRFAEQGAQVLATGSSQSSVDSAKQRAGSRYELMVCDVSRMTDLDTLADTAKTTLGSVDILFANAGIAHFAPIEEMTEDKFDHVMAVNVKGLYFSIQRLLPLMPKGAVIVATGSIAPRKGQSAVAAYAASKGAVRAIVRNLAAELLDREIRINCLAPGPVRTNIFSRMTGGDQAAADATLARIADIVPMSRVGNTEEIAEAVEYLCGPGAAYMLGSELTLDGGKAEL